MTSPTELSEAGGALVTGALTPRTDDSTLASSLIALGMQAQHPLDIAGTPGVLLPENARIAMFPELRSRPAHARVEHNFSHVESFLAYLEHHDVGETAVFIDFRTGAMRGFVDYHGRGGDAPNWCRHEVRFALTPNDAWATWRKNDRKFMPQGEFAEFIEENALDVVKPETARLLEIITTFKANKNLRFRSAVNQTDGSVNLVFEESVESGGGASGRIALPDELHLGVHLFDGLPAYKAVAKLRYRVPQPGQPLTFCYVLVRPAALEQDAIASVIQTVESHPEITSYRATPRFLG